MVRVLCVVLLGVASACSDGAPTAAATAGGHSGLGGTGAQTGQGGGGRAGTSPLTGANCDRPVSCLYAEVPPVLGESCEVEGDACTGPMWLASHCGLVTKANCCNGVWEYGADCESSGRAGEGGQSGAGTAGEGGQTAAGEGGQTAAGEGGQSGAGAAGEGGR